MERIDELLDKYFSGETSINEENELKTYFLSGKINEEHQVYAPLFEVFMQEKLEKPIRKITFPTRYKQTTKQLWIRSFAYTGIAATVLLALWIQIPKLQQKPENFAMVSGVRIENQEYVQKYTEKKLNKVNQILKNSMSPMQSFETVRKGLEPMKKINETKQKISDIENKLPFK
jgi:hypothetical protein